MYFSTIKLKHSVIDLKLQKQVALTGLEEKQNKTETSSVGREGEMNLQRVRVGCKYDQNTHETLKELIKYYTTYSLKISYIHAI